MISIRTSIEAGIRKLNIRFVTMFLFTIIPNGIKNIDIKRIRKIVTSNEAIRFSPPWSYKLLNIHEVPNENIDTPNKYDKYMLVFLSE
tara:strand:- start:173 stop:436 length:264 start_codon:yes stop_codon:yes gene_type:complete